jgi:hypothetical protein
VLVEVNEPVGTAQIELTVDIADAIHWARIEEDAEEVQWLAEAEREEAAI